MTKLYRGYKVKLYPNKEQEQELLKIAGACRFVYNYFLDLKKNTYITEKKNLGYSQLSKRLTVLRKNTEWMKEVQYQPLQQSLRILDVAYNNFFRGNAKFPNFKRKYGKQSFRKVDGWNVDNNRIKIHKGLSIKFRGAFPENREGTLTISRDGCGNWYASTLAKINIENRKLIGGIGLDMGLKSLVVTSDGEKYDNPRVLGGLLKRIKSCSKSLSRTQKGSANRSKRRIELARTYRKVERVKKNGLHHVSRAIVDKNHAMIAIENLAIQNMIKNRKLSSTISDASWGDLIRQITYKQEWIGGKVVKINRFFPSSKTCSNCYFVLQTLPLSIREWTCPKCKVTHDRDVNAAKMILKQAEERPDVEAGDGSHRVRSLVRVTRPMKHEHL